MNYLIEAQPDQNRETFFWIVSTSQDQINKHRKQLLSAMTDLADWILAKHPLMIVPLSSERKYGSIFRNLWLISPDKFSGIDDVFVCNTSFFALLHPNFCDLIHLFYSNQSKCKELLLEWSNEEQLLIGGVL